MAGQTNIIVDGSSEYEVVRQMLAFIDATLESMGKTEEAKMARKLLDYMGNDAGKIIYKLVDNKYTEEFKERLKEEGIPYMMSHDNRGNAAFFVRDCDQEKFMTLQNDIFKLHSEFYAQMTVKEMCDIERRKGSKTVIELAVDNQPDADYLQAKLYSGEQGIVAAVADYPESDNQRKGYKMYVDPDSVFKDGKDLSKAADLGTLEFEWAFERADPDYMDYQMDQSRYDKNEIDILMNALERGEHVCVVNEVNDQDNPYKIEFKYGTAMILQKQKDGRWRTERDLEIPKDFSNKDEVRAFKAALRANLEKIHNMRVVTPERAEEIEKKTSDELKEEIMKEDQDPYIYGIHKPKDVEYNITGVEEKRPHRPNIEYNLVIQGKDGVKYTGQQFLKDKKQENQKDKVIPPNSPARKQFIQLNMIHGEKGKRLISQIEGEAKQRVKNRRDFVILTPSQKYNLFKRELITVTKESIEFAKEFKQNYGTTPKNNTEKAVASMMEDKDFISYNKNVEEKDQIDIVEILEGFEKDFEYANQNDRHEEHDLEIKERKVDEVRKEEKERDKAKNKDKEPEYDKNQDYEEEEEHERKR